MTEKMGNNEVREGFIDSDGRVHSRPWGERQDWKTFNFESICFEARMLHSQYLAGERITGIQPQDQLEYWIAVVAYQRSPGVLAAEIKRLLAELAQARHDTEHLRMSKDDEIDRLRGQLNRTPMGSTRWR
jgi:hypothetical protein